jgi:hypothetical protein
MRSLLYSVLKWYNRGMSQTKDKNEKDISAAYATKLFHEESMISGFLHVKIQRIRYLMKTWKSESEKKQKNNPEEKDLDR